MTQQPSGAFAAIRALRRPCGLVKKAREAGREAKVATGTAWKQRLNPSGAQGNARRRRTALRPTFPPEMPAGLHCAPRDRRSLKPWVSPLD